MDWTFVGLSSFKVGVGILMLAGGAMWLVDSASRLALRMGVSPFVVGVTVVGFGTSMPELMVSVLAAGRGSGGMSLGNAVGSNVMNLLLVLGVAAVVAKVEVVGGRRMIRRDLLFGLLPALLLISTAWNGHINRIQAVLLLTIFTLFMLACLRNARANSAEPEKIKGSQVKDVVVGIIGIALLVAGADLMVRGGVDLARTFGISEAVIGLTLVAFGTSLPELATSVAASLKGEAELSVGNVLGSNVFNLGLIVGTAFTIRPGAVPAFVIRQDLPFLVLTSLFVGVYVLRNGEIDRRNGTMMLAVFTAYVAFVIVRGG